MSIPSLVMNDGRSIPQIGLGVWQVPDDVATDACLAALECGYRHIDTAALYYNEEGVGRAIAACGLPRKELFITTKVWNTDQGYDATMRAFELSLSKLGLDYVDLYLIHWPTPGRDLYADTWRALVDLRADGRAASIGVSNFHEAHIRRVVAETGEVPAINQVELHPWLPQREVRAVDAEFGILTEGWSPLGSGRLIDDPILQGIADRHGVTTAQVMIRWQIQLGNVVLPKSVTPARIRSNIDVFGFALDGEDLALIDSLASGQRTGPDPDVFNEA
jgi:2,5-diketo-D-gluconate reductase A